MQKLSFNILHTKLLTTVLLIEHISLSECLPSAWTEALKLLVDYSSLQMMT